MTVLLTAVLERGEVGDVALVSPARATSVLLCLAEGSGKFDPCRLWDGGGGIALRELVAAVLISDRGLGDEGPPFLVGCGRREAEACIMPC